MKNQFTLKSGLELEIQQPTVEDAQAILDYLEQISGESNNITFGPGELGVILEQEKKFLSRMKEDEENILVIGTIDAEIVSVANISTGRRKRMRHTGEIAVSVQKKYWNHGIGRIIMLELIKWGKNIRKLRKINLKVKEGNSSAIHLYKTLGFQREGEISRGFQIDGQFFSLICMGLEL